IPDHRLYDWAKIVDGVRKKGARVVVLNHPRWPALLRSPFADYGLNHLTGDASPALVAAFDGIEVINSTFLLPDPMLGLADWFALLNGGDHVFAVGTSDTHTVESPPGQGRTYVKSHADSPRAIDEDEIYRSFLEGRTSVSFGIVTGVEVDGRFSS